MHIKDRGSTVAFNIIQIESRPVEGTTRNVINRIVRFWGVAKLRNSADHKRSAVIVTNGPRSYHTVKKPEISKKAV